MTNTDSKAVSISDLVDMSTHNEDVASEEKQQYSKDESQFAAISSLTKLQLQEESKDEPKVTSSSKDRRDIIKNFSVEQQKKFDNMKNSESWRRTSKLSPPPCYSTFTASPVILKMSNMVLYCLIELCFIAFAFTLNFNSRVFPLGFKRRIRKKRITLLHT